MKPGCAYRSAGDHQRGAVLLNALALVAAMAAAAAGVLGLAGQGTVRLLALGAEAQARLYLDAGEDLVAAVLIADHEAGGTLDHLDEVWATEGYAVPIGRGVLSGQLADLQGRFNVNRLADPEDTAAPAAFDRLLSGLGLEPSLAGAVADFLRPGGPLNPDAYANGALPVRPTGGVAETVAMLRAVPGMTDAAFAKLAPNIAALPVGSPLNLNTAPAPVLAATLPALGARGAAEAVALRAVDPFGSVARFAARVGTAVRADILDGIDAETLDVRSEWFEATLTAVLDTGQARRSVVLRRNAQSGAVAVTFRAAEP